MLAHGRSYAAVLPRGRHRSSPPVPSTCQPMANTRGEAEGGGGLGIKSRRGLWAGGRVALVQLGLPPPTEPGPRELFQLATT
jgi:hypothetical protein